MSTFLTADTHFGHAAVLHGCSRPFASIAEMDEALINNWNAVVHLRDTIWHLGDFALACDSDHISTIFDRLNGRKKLIIGNHDVDRKGRLKKALADLPWEDVAHRAEIKHEGRRIQLSHYAGLTWNAQHYGSLEAFGHSHGRLVSLPGSIDVGVDVQGYRPIAVGDFVRQAEASLRNAPATVAKLALSLEARVPLFIERASMNGGRR